MIWSGWRCPPAVGERVFVERDVRQNSMLTELHGDSVRATRAVSDDYGADDTMTLTTMTTATIQGWNKGET